MQPSLRTNLAAQRVRDTSATRLDPDGRAIFQQHAHVLRPTLASDLSGPAEQARMAEKKSHV
jgi:hypothetical protein